MPKTTTTTKKKKKKKKNEILVDLLLSITKNCLSSMEANLCQNQDI